jgi:putative endonuclease
VVFTKDPAEVGRWGENVARSFFERCGFVCLASRYRCPGGEIDLVMARAALVVFVEVKTRSGPLAGRPEESVPPAKILRLRRAARHFLWRHPPRDVARLRFDVVALENHGEGRGFVFRHLAGIR